MGFGLGKARQGNRADGEVHREITGQTLEYIDAKADKQSAE